jgi:hypothetical protein
MYCIGANYRVCQLIGAIPPDQLFRSPSEIKSPVILAIAGLLSYDGTRLPRLCSMPSYHYHYPSTSEAVQQRLLQLDGNVATLRGTLHPSGRVTIGKLPRAKVSKADNEYECTRGQYTYFERVHWHYSKGLVSESFVREEKPSLLGLSSVRNCQKSGTKKKYGRHGLTSLGRMKVREGAYLLHKRHGRRLGFYTLTCPYVDAEGIGAYNRSIAEIQRQFFQRLKIEYAGLGMAFNYVSVIEVQTKRFASTGQTVLHIHYIAPCYKPGEWEFVCSADTLRDIYAQCTRNATGIPCETEAAVDATVVRKSAVGYISKYMSKGGEEVRECFEGREDEMPSQWWSINSQVRKAIARCSTSLPLEVCEYIFQSGKGNPGELLELLYCKYIYLRIEDYEYRIGLSGQMGKVGISALRNWDMGDLCKLL